MANEKRLIDVEQAKRATYEEVFWTESEQAVVRNFIVKLPKVDAVEVVRCENCQYWNPRYETMGMCMKHNSIVTFTKPDFYCAWGKEKNNGICKKG